MEEYGGLGPEAGLLRLNTSIQLLIQKVARLCRMALTAVALLLLVSVALLITFWFGRRCHVSPDGQAKMPPDRNPSDVDIQPGTARFQANTAIQNPSAMLTAPPGNPLCGDYLRWEKEAGNAFCQGGFTYSNGDLVVPKTGVYKVFLQITYESKGEQCSKPEMKLNNTVLRYGSSYNTDVPLLTSFDTVRFSNEPWIKSLYMSGLFQLEAGDKLRVQSKFPQCIASNEDQTFFGAQLSPH